MNDYIMVILRRMAIGIFLGGIVFGGLLFGTCWVIFWLFKHLSVSWS
jgi:hypothetical protein